MKHELLVPVGNYDCLIAAINNGADAVYLGGKKFGARAFADNFSLEDISEATKLCHLYGVKIFITVNTLIFESEFDEGINYIRELHKIGVDAVIMQDVGLINVVHQKFPNLEIHASTQMHNHSKESLKFLENLGVKRVVFARELSLDYINNIETNLEKEAFIHGSLCVSYSGQCYFSSLILNRSGNRGECAGMCRLPYELYEDDKKVSAEGNYLLSPKDICSIDKFKALMDSNILSFKIEGRMKSPEYVGMVTKIYRTLMDQYENGEELSISKDDWFMLKAIFNREYTGSYLHKDNDIMNFLAPNHQGVSIGKVISASKYIGIKLTSDINQFDGIRFKDANKGMIVNFLYDDKYKLINKGIKDNIIYLDNKLKINVDDEVFLTNPQIELAKEVVKKVGVKFSLKAYVNEKINLLVSDGINNIEVEDFVVEESKTFPVTKERIEEVLQKCGNTPFVVNNIEISQDENIFIPIGELNRIRRKALDKLKEIRENKKTKFIEKEYFDNSEKMEITNSINVLVRTKEQLEVCKKMNVDNIIVNDPSLLSDEVVFRIPRDSMNHSYEHKKLLVTDHASLDKYPNQMSDYFLNVTNHYTLDYISKLSKSVCLSIECDYQKLESIMSSYKESTPNVEVYVYGNVELMLMKYCPLNKIVNKERVCKVCSNNKKYYLKDRNGLLHKIENNKLTHSSALLNGKKINLIQNIKELKRIGITNFRLEFLEETKEEVEQIIESVRKEL